MAVGSVEWVARFPGPAVVVSIPGGEVLQRSPLASRWSVLAAITNIREIPRFAGLASDTQDAIAGLIDALLRGNSVDQHVDTPFGAVRCFGFLLDERSAFFAAQAVSSSSEAAADRAERTADALLTAASPDLQLLFDAELRIVHASEAVLAEVPGGAVLADLVGRRMRDVGVEEPEAVLVEADLREALESGLPLRRDRFFEGRLWDVVVAPVDPDGARLVMVSGRDITSRQASVERHEERIGDAAALEQLLGFGTFTWDLESGRVDCSENLFRLGESDPSLVPGPDAVARVGGSDTASLEEVIRAVAAAGTTRLCVRHRQPDGAPIAFHLRATGPGRVSGVAVPVGGVGSAVLPAASGATAVVERSDATDVAGGIGIDLRAAAPLPYLRIGDDTSWERAAAALRRAPGWSMTTEREREVVLLTLRGLRSGEVATRLWLSASTVRNHLSSAYRKLGVRGQRELALLVAREDRVRMQAEPGDGRPAMRPPAEPS